MIKGSNGGSPSRNGGDPDKDKGKEKEPPPKGSSQIELVITDRLDALERALGTVRRRGMSFQIQSLARRDGELVLVFRADPGAAIHDRWLAELAALVDVHQVNVAKF